MGHAWRGIAEVAPDVLAFELNLIEQDERVRDSFWGITLPTTWRSYSPVVTAGSKFS